MNTPLRPLVVILGCGLANTAAAQPPITGSPAEMMKQADTNGDGRVSLDEFLKARTAVLEQAFARMDADGSGAIEQNEMEAAAERMRSMAAGAGAGGGLRRPEGMRPERPEGRGLPRTGGEQPGGERPGTERRDGERPGGGGMAAGAFDRFDSDGDGRLSREEFEAGMARMREFMQRQQGPGNGGLGRAAPGRGGPEEGFRRPPSQD
jgi:hypothetical protein